MRLHPAISDDRALHHQPRSGNLMAKSLAPVDGDELLQARCFRTRDAHPLRARGAIRSHARVEGCSPGAFGNAVGGAREKYAKLSQRATASRARIFSGSATWLPSSVTLSRGTPAATSASATDRNDDPLNPGPSSTARK